MFYGQYSHSLDSKGRLIVPSKFRDVLRENYGEKFYVTAGADKCLLAYLEDEWDKLQKKVRDLPEGKAKARTLKRIMFSQACDVLCDKQGRILIPKNLLDFAAIRKDVIIAGVGNHFEIWDVKLWSQDYEGSLGTYQEIVEELSEEGF